MTPTMRSTLALTLLLACTPTVRESAGSSSVETPAPEPEPTAAGPDQPVAEPPAPEPASIAAVPDLAALVGPLRFSPVEAGDGRLPADNTALIEANGGTMLDHAIDFGWSVDGSHFGWCLPSGGAVCTTCELTEVASGKTKTMQRGSECERHDSKAIAAAWKAHGIGKQPIPTSWRYGRDLTIAWVEEDGEEGPDGTALRLSRLRVGASLPGDRPGFAISMVEPTFADIAANYLFFPELILPSPDGSKIAVLSHAFAGEFSDTLRLVVEPADAFAFAAYHESGLAALKRHPKRAVERFTIAAAIAPEQWKAWYNLACAHAKAGDPDRAQAPLERAIAAGSDAARSKAASDPDLAAARERPWFAALVK